MGVESKAEGTKLDRKLDIIVTEREVEDPSGLKLGKMGLLGVVALIAGIVGWSLFGPTVGALLCGGGLGLMRIGVMGRTRVFEPVLRNARVRISPAGIAVEREALIARANIAQAFYQPRRAGRGSVRCLDARNNVVFETQIDSADEAHEILAALGGDVGQKRARFDIGSPILTGPVGGFLRILVFFGAIGGALSAIGHGLLPLVLLALMVAYFVITLKGQSVEVGVDGVLVEWWGRKRFIGYEAITALESVGKDIVLVLRDGTRVLLRSSIGSLKLHDSSLVADALFARLEEARRVFDAHASARELAARAARGARDVAEWRAELARLHEPEGGGSYRDPAARGDDLWRVVEDTSAPEDARAGAAVALRNEDGAHPRLRIAAEAVASPKLRVALEKASDPAADDEALDEALEAFDRREA